ncbi:hypothetical protein V8C44DRAFT_170516 [Trichoderma aethiopicum]
MLLISTGYLQLHCVYAQPFRSLYLICEDCMGCRLPNGRRGRPFAISLNGERDEARLGSAAASHIPACAAKRCLWLGRGMAEPFFPLPSRQDLDGFLVAGAQHNPRLSATPRANLRDSVPLKLSDLGILPERLREESS